MKTPARERRGRNTTMQDTTLTKLGCAVIIAARPANDKEVRMSAAEKIIHLFPPQPQPEPPKPVKKAKPAASKPTYGHSGSKRKRKHFRYTDAQGVSREHTVYGATAAEAERNKQAFLMDVALSLRVDQRGRTVASWADEWYQTYIEPGGIDEKSLEMYAHNVGLIKQHLGQMRLSSITEADCKRVIDLRAGMSESTISKTAIVLKRLFKAAVRNRLIPYNPAEELPLPEGTAGSHRVITAEEWQLVMAVVKSGHRFATAAMLILFCGLRPAEAYAVDLEHDVYLTTRWLRVRHGIKWVKNKPRLKLPKTKAGIRWVPIPAPLAEYLERIELKGYALHMTGKPHELPTKQATRVAWRSFVRHMETELNGTTYRWRDQDKSWQTVSIERYDLRHTWFSLLYDAEVDVKSAQKWGGHARIETTLRIYTHLSQQREEKSAAQLDKVLFGGMPPRSLGDKNGDRVIKYRLKSKTRQHNSDKLPPDS